MNLNNAVTVDFGEVNTQVNDQILAGLRDVLKETFKGSFEIDFDNNILTIEKTGRFAEQDDQAIRAFLGYLYFVECKKVLGNPII